MVPVKGILKGATVLVDAFGIKDLVQLGASLTQQGIDAGIKAHARREEEKQNLVKVPEIISTDYRLGLEDAKRWLTEDGLSVEAVVVKPDIKYKDCVPLEVVATNYRINQKVKRGERIILRYITEDVIEESKRLYHESIDKKEKSKRAKDEKKVENKQKIDETLSGVKTGFVSAINATQNGVGGIVSKLSKKSVVEDKNENNYVNPTSSIVKKED